MRHLHVWSVTALSLLGLAAAAGAQAQTQETEVPGVTATLAYARQTDGILRVGILLKNTTSATVARGNSFRYAEVYVIDGVSKKKQFPLKDAGGHFLAGPTSDWNNGGRWFPHYDSQTETLLWFMFDAVPADHQIAIHVPGLQPFDEVKVVEGGATGDPGSSVPPLRASLVSATRSAGELKVRLKIVNPGKTAVRTVQTVYYDDAHVFDPQSKRLYSVLKDTEGAYSAEPVSDRNRGGRWFMQKVAPGGQVFMSLTFQAPPDSVGAVDILIPWFAPIEAVAIAGTGGAEPAGTAVAGKTLDLQGALKDLHAEVTAQQIKVSLAADLLFDFDKADIKPAAEPQLDKVVTVLKGSPGATVSIEGHADGKGAEAYNQTLSEKRAAAVAQWLAARAGLPSSAIRTKGWGASKPVAPNTTPAGADNPDGRAQNRRVEIIVNRQ
jgi:outer membrane protein OmpA-like peptidoglycan-associated protein